MARTKRRGLQLLMALLALGTPLAVHSTAADRDTRVVTAAKRDDLAGVRALIKERGDVNVPDGDGSPALLWAAYHADLPMAQALMAAGAKVQVANRYGVTPILQASRVGDASLVAALLKGGADPKSAHTEGETPLMAAAGAGSVDTVKLLIANGADPNAREEGQGQTALMWAAGEGHVDVVRVLIETGAALDVVAKPTAIEKRRHADHPSGGLTALMFAAREGRSDVVRVLADAGADLNHANPDGATAMMIAIINDRFDLAGMLLDKGANANDGSLYHAVEMHNMARDVFANDPTRPRVDHPNTLTALDLITRLLERGANPNGVFKGALHSVGNCCAANINATPFYRAAQAADVAAIRLMLAKGANPNLGSSEAVDPDAPAATTTAAPSSQPPLLAAMASGAGAARGGGPGQNRVGGVQYREAADRNPVTAVTLLLDAGANVNVLTPQGDTPLHAGAQSGSVAMIQLLVDHGAKLDAQNKAGLTPLDVAMGKTPPGAAAAPPALGAGRGRGGPAGPQPAAIALLRQLMGLPPEVAPPARPARGENQP